jgi:ADP-ribose pyrophosphatase YjhB (NUDIX family)
MARAIRPIAICILHHDDEILVMEARDESRDLTFYRPLGGGIEFGERSVAAVRRELREEIGAELEAVSLLTILENVFEFEGEAGHEIVFVYAATFADPSLYERRAFVVTEGSTTLPAVWRRLSEFDMAEAPLYPDGLLAYLRDP